MRFPNDEEAEASILGSLIVAPELAGAALDRLQAEDFYRSEHRVVFQQMRELYAMGGSTDLISLKAALAAAGRPVDPITLIDLAQGVGVLDRTAVAHWVEIVLEASRRRKMMVSASEVLNAAENPAQDPTDALGTLMDDLSWRRVSGRHDAAELASTALDDIERIQRGEAIRGVQTGLRDLDRWLHGLKPQNLIVVAARPGVGKSSLALTIARHAAIDGVNTVLFSLEMSAWELGMRLVAAEADLSMWEISTGQLKPEAWEVALNAAAQVATWPLMVLDEGAVRITDVRAQLRELSSRKTVGLVIVDYLQLMLGESRRSDRQVEVADISRGLKVAAKEMDVPIIAVSQLNREVERRTSKVPQLADLRESGAVEQDADVVMLMHRDQEDEGQVHLNIAKHRNGPTAIVKLRWHPDRMVFTDWPVLGY